MIAELKKKYGYKCSGIKINYKGSCVNSPTIKLRFCEAVHHSFNIPLLLNANNLSCKGSFRSFGLSKSDEELITHISNECKISEKSIKNVLKDIPAFDKPVKNILLGIPNELEESIGPDLFILHIKPKDAMDLIRLNMIRTNNSAIIKPYPFLSVCGNVLATSLKTKQISISIGCADSRKFGGVDDNNVVVGIPYNICKKLFN